MFFRVLFLPRAHTHYPSIWVMLCATCCMLSDFPLPSALPPWLLSLPCAFYGDISLRTGAIPPYNWASVAAPSPFLFHGLHMYKSQLWTGFLCHVFQLDVNKYLEERGLLISTGGSLQIPALTLPGSTCAHVPKVCLPQLHRSIQMTAVLSETQSSYSQKKVFFITASLLSRNEFHR